AAAAAAAAFPLLAHSRPPALFSTWLPCPLVTVVWSFGFVCAPACAAGSRGSKGEGTKNQSKGRSERFGSEQRPATAAQREADERKRRGINSDDGEMNPT